MTAVTDERSGASQVSKVEIEENISLHLSSCEDLRKVGGECNGIVHDGVEEIGGDVKNDGDGSYVFVNGPDAVSDELGENDLDAEAVADPAEIVETVPAVEGETISELNFGSETGEKQVEVGELKIENISSDQPPVEHSCNNDGSVVYSSANVTAVENSQSQREGSEIEKNDTDNEQNKTVLAPDVEGNQESIFMTTEAVESKLPQLDRDEVERQIGTVSLAEVESGEVEENKESITIKEAVECNFQQLDNEEKVREVDGVEKNEEQIKLDSATEVKENQESETMVEDAAESEAHQLHDGEEEAEEPRKLDLATKGENQESQVTDTMDVELELGQLDNREKDPEISDEIPVDNLSGGIGLEAATAPVDTQLEAEALNGSVESGESLPDDPVASETEAIHDLVVCNGNMTFSAHIETKLENVDGSAENAEGLPRLVDKVEQETEVGNVAVEHGESLPMDPVNDTMSEAEVRNVDGSAENPESLPHMVDKVEQETEVGNVAVEHGESLPMDPVNDTMSEAEVRNVAGSAENPESLPHMVDKFEQETAVGNVAVELGESLPTDTVNNIMLETEVRNPCVEIGESLPVEGAKLETVVVNGSTDVVESRPTCAAGDGKSETDISNGSIEGDISIPTCLTENLEIKLEVMDGLAESAKSLPSCSVIDAEVESEVLSSVENGISLPTYHVADVELGPEAGNGSGTSGCVPSAEAVNFRAIVQDGSVENGEAAAHTVNDVIDGENEGTQPTSGDSDDKSICEEVDTEGIQGDEGPQSSAKGSTVDAVDEQKVDTEVVKKPFHFFIKIPRYVDDKLREQIRLAQLQVEEKTQSRDAIRATIQIIRATCNECRDKFEAAKSEERNARDALNVKRQETDSVQSAISIDDIDERIHNMEHMIQHETMPLKEEKQLIREIKQLKQLREQLSSQMGRQDERQQASDQRDKIEERFKLLKQELDSLRKKVSHTEGITKAAREKYFVENEKLRKLQSQFKAADDLRQEAYSHLQNLRKELYEKSKYFRMYKDEQRAANDFASARDREALQRLCVDQVERVMELWNKNDEFRKNYIQCNTMSTLRRLRTLDGRSLGPDEEPPVIHSVVDERVDSALAASSHIDSSLVFSPSEPEKTVVPPGAERGDVKSVVKVQQENATAKSKKASKPTALENGSVTFPGREEKEKVEEENKKSKEEEELARKAEELARKAEELRREEAAARLKEQRRLEEKVKAKEAEERKKRNAEKAQARAELRAQREAELKEKEREKRAKKKERKKATAAEGGNVGTEGESCPSTENTPSETTACEPEIREKTTPVVKRLQKPSLLTKQSKAKPLPPPLRNRGKRRMQTWMWFLIVTLLVLALFFLGSVGVSFKFGLPTFGF